MEFNLQILGGPGSCNKSAHRKKFTAWSGLDYGTHLPPTISFVPPASIYNILQEDYKQMQLGFIYGEAPSFNEIMEQLLVLQDRFRKISWAVDR